MKEADWCYGSAGICNISQPEQAQALLDRKVKHVKNTGCTLVVISNPGCHLHLQNGLGGDYQIVHPVNLLAKAYSGNGLYCFDLSDENTAFYSPGIDPSLILVIQNYE